MHSFYKKLSKKGRVKSDGGAIRDRFLDRSSVASKTILRNVCCIQSFYVLISFPRNIVLFNRINYCSLFPSNDMAPCSEVRLFVSSVLEDFL